MASTMSTRVGKIIHRNHGAQGVQAKTAIRRNVLAAVGASRAVVFDGFAGQGAMYRAVWSAASHCVGCDFDFFPGDDRLAYAADNRRVLRALDLDRFNIFDCDAWGDPWEQVFIVAERRRLRPAETLGLVLTDGQTLKVQYQHRPSRALCRLAGVDHAIPGMHREMELIFDRALHRVAAMMGGTIARRWQATAPNRSVMRYLGAVLTA